jgi:hypothetical protein
VIWALQLPAALVATVTVVVTVGLAVLGLVVTRRVIPQRRLESVRDVGRTVFSLAGVLYAVLVGFVVVVVWQQFNDARARTEAEAAAIADLVHTCDGLPAANQPAIQQSVFAYINDVVNDEYPRMRRGEPIEQQSKHLTAIWHDVLAVKPANQIEYSFYNQAITRLNELDNARTARIVATEYRIPGELWILLLGGGAIMLLFTYLFATPDVVLHGVLIALCGALMAFVLYLIFALEHPFIGTIAVPDTPYRNVLNAWPELTNP